MKKNVCIIQFNTPVLTAHLVKSINKHTPDTNIFIFDNSDKLPFRNEFKNVTVFDNTKGQIINFDEWLKKYPNKEKSGGKANKWGSAKHAYSVEKCMNLINEPFVLLDSDVLIKKDITPLFDDIVCYKGEVIYQPKSKVKRVLPFICFINTKKCKECGVHYFDENYMHGLRVGIAGDSYDTGAALYLLTERKKAPHREIKVADYIVHYGNGSWVSAAEKMKKPKHIPPQEWLNKYKSFWDDNVGVKKPAKDVKFNEVFSHIYCLHYLSDNKRLPKLKSELERVGIDENADYFSWVYDYPSPLLDLVFQNEKLNLSLAVRSSSRPYIKRVALKHYEIIKDAYEKGYERILILENDIRFHNDIDYINQMLENIPGTDVVMFDKMTCSAPGEATKYKQYIKTLQKDALYGSMNDSGVFFVFCSCYALNREGMRKIIDIQEKSLMPPDTPLNDKSLTGSFAIINLAIQDPKLKTRKNETYDKIGLPTNVYGVEEVFDWEENIVTKPVAEEKTKIIQKISQPSLKKKLQTNSGQNVKVVSKGKNNVTFVVPAKPKPIRKIEPVQKVMPKKPIVKPDSSLIKKRVIMVGKKRYRQKPGLFPVRTVISINCMMYSLDN